MLDRFYFIPRKIKKRDRKLDTGERHGFDRYSLIVSLWRENLVITPSRSCRRTESTLHSLNKYTSAQILDITIEIKRNFLSPPNSENEK